MIGYLSGDVISTSIQSVLLNVQGVGYFVHVPITVAKSASIGDALELHCHLVVREDALSLYGFATADDQQVFEHLISVSGVGPKIGLSILSTYTASEIQSAVATGNAAAFSAVSGIGKKNADRIILELKNKLAVATGMTDLGADGPNELTTALIALGYSTSEITKISQDIDTTLPLQQQIKQALAKMR